MDIEKSLRASLARRDPGAGFADAVIARVGAPQASRHRSVRWRMPAALAATVLAAASGLHWHQAQQHARESRQQLQLALAITSQQLDQVQQMLVEPTPETVQENGT